MAKKKGANNAGTIRQRADGRWEGRVTLGTNPGTGKPIRKSVYAATQREVRQAMQKILVEVDEGIYTQPSKLTVKQWSEEWLREYTPDVKPSTRARYESDFRNHILPALGSVKLSALTPSMIQKFYNDLQRGEKPISAKSVRNVNGVLHQALKQAVKLGYIRSNPTEACTLPRVEKTEIQPLDAPAIKVFLDSLGNDVYSTVYKVDLLTGMRHGEILGLAWSDIDFDRGTITINKQLILTRGENAGYRFGTLKNDKPRTIQPAPCVIEWLRERRIAQLQDRLRVGPLWDEGGFPDLVFTSETGAHLSFRVVLKHLKKALEKAGLPDKRFHDLRHSFAVASIMAGDDARTLQQNLGHSTPGFSMTVYAHVTKSMQEASSRRMQTFIDGLK